MKIKNILWSLFVLVGIGSQTQAQIKAPSAETLKAFTSSKTYIVLEDAMFSDFNANIKEAAQQHWKITPFEIISLEQFEKRCRTPQSSFLMVVMGEYTGGFVRNSTFNVLTLMMGHQSGDINKMPEILSIPLSYYVPDGDEEEYGYKLGGILEGVQYAVRNILPRKTTVTNFKDIFSNYSYEVKTKELWVTKNDLSSSVNTIEKIKPIYPYKVVITSEQLIQQAIDEKKHNVAFLHKVGNATVRNATCLKLIINCADGKLLYGDYHSISTKEPDGLLPGDFKALQE
jgi:hypothetical protein